MMCESCQATHPTSRRHIGVSRSSKVFTITADTSNGLVTFGMLGHIVVRVWYDFTYQQEQQPKKVLNVKIVIKIA